MPGWKLYGKGSYNVVFKSKEDITLKANETTHTGSVVIKIPNQQDDLNNPERAVRVWREINPDLPAELTEVNVNKMSLQGWMAPFVEGREGRDAEVAAGVRQVYLKSRRIIADACTSGNFIVSKGVPICVDVDVAFKRHSVASEIYLKNLSREYIRFWSTPYNRENFPFTIKTIKSLFYMETFLKPDDILDKYISEPVLDLVYLCLEKHIPIEKDDLDSFHELSKDKEEVDYDSIIDSLIIKEVPIVSKKRYQFFSCDSSDTSETSAQNTTPYQYQNTF